MNITNESIIGEIVAKDYRVATVFQQKGIDFCCNGNKAIKEVCKDKNLDPIDLINQLKEQLNDKNGSSIDYNSWQLDLLAEYIEKKHHRYCEAKITEILPYLEKIVGVHGSRHPELSEVLAIFKETASELSKHMKKEEIMLFPRIKKIANMKPTDKPQQSNLATLTSTIQMMMNEHTDEGERFERLAELTNNYTPPADGCNTYKVTFSMLKEFEEDLHLHIHLENNILFPKTINLESTFIHT